MKEHTISSTRQAELRTHPSAQDLGNGWVILADTNCFASVLLVSKVRAIARSFPYDKPYHTFLRAQIRATFHAENNPEQVQEAALLAA